MKNLYKITKEQLIVIWVFGVIGEIWLLIQINSRTLIPSIGSTKDLTIEMFIIWLLPMLLIFYTLGWRENNTK